MPPVFGPRSPSPMRLKSRAGARATAVSPSHKAGDERRLRADDDELRVFALRQGDEARDVGDADVEAPRVALDAGVAGCADQPRALGRARQRADDRVLAAPAADDEDDGTLGPGG